eukprot:m.489667 g.489667  ORF g.489667 m.489667 type:complete len:333 (+) comp26997_c0_seq1:87-1085(+)
MGDASAIDRYTLGRKLGKGSFASVYAATDRVTGQEVAVKVADCESKQCRFEDLQREVLALAQCHSPHIVRLHNAFCSPNQRLHIVMEHMPCSVADLLLKQGALPEPSLAAVLRDSLLGLQYLHSTGVAHRDIKPANILVGLDGHGKLCDFGVTGNEVTDAEEQAAAKAGRRSCEWLPSKSAGRGGDASFVGTPFYMAPEVLGKDCNGPKADVWSLGISAIEMVTNKLPRGDLHPLKVFVATTREPPPELTGSFSPKCKDFVAQCLLKDYLKRPSADVLLAHKFVKGAKKAPKLAAAVKKFVQDTQNASHANDSDSDSDDEGDRFVFEQQWDL